jgi:hypothetical protein
MRRNRRALAAVRRALGDLPGLVISPKNGAREMRIEIRLPGGKPYRLDLAWLPEGWPSDVKTALGQFTGSSRHPLVVVAPSLSPGAIEVLRERRVNWVDELGNVRLVVPPGLALLKSAPPARRRTLHSFAWSPAKVRIAEILLTEPVMKHELKSISSRTGVSIPQVSNVLGAFDRQGWTERHGPRRGRGVWRAVVKPGSMLESWTDHLRTAPPPRRSGHRVLRDVLQFLRSELAPLLPGTLEWAVTGWAGAALLAPSVTLTPVLHLYIAADDFDRVAAGVFKAAKIRPVESGSNVELRRADRPLLRFPAGETGLPVVSPARLYADLMALGGRGEDAARNVRETVLGY